MQENIAGMQRHMLNNKQVALFPRTAHHKQICVLLQRALQKAMPKRKTQFPWMTHAADSCPADVNARAPINKKNLPYRPSDKLSGPHRLTLWEACILNMEQPVESFSLGNYDAQELATAKACAQAVLARAGVSCMPLHLCLVVRLLKAP